MQKHKLANLLLALSPLCIYLEWGSGMHSFLIEAEARVLSGLWSHPEEALHPFVLLPLTGQVLLLATLFQQRPGFWLSAAGMVCLGLLPWFIFVVSLLGLRYPMLLSTLPFVAVFVYAIVLMYRKKRERPA